MKKIGKEEAINAIRRCAFEVKDEDSSDFGRTIIHSFLGMFGADHDVESAIEYINNSDEIAIIDDMFNHNLAVRVGDKVYRYDVREM